MTKFFFANCTTVNFIFQCDCSYEYNNSLFHVMGHNVEKDEAYMWATMVEYIEKEAEAVTSVTGDFLKRKGQNWQIISLY